MYSEPITIRDFITRSIHIKSADGKCQTRVQGDGTLTQEVAETLGAKSLVFAPNGTPKEGFSSLQLDTGCGAFRAVFQADPALKQSFEVPSGDSSDQYTVERQEEGLLKLKLRLNYHGDPHQAVAYLAAVGNAESLLKIVPLQSEINTEADEEDNEEAEKDLQEPLYQPEQHPGVEPARQTLISGRRHGRKRTQV